MEKEVIDICNRFSKNEELIFECKVKSPLLKIGEQCIINYLVFHDYDWRLSTFQMKTLDGKIIFRVHSEELINLFKIKDSMEKEVRAMLDKGEKVTLVAIDECVMSYDSNIKALIIGKEYPVLEMYSRGIIIKSEYIEKHCFEFDNLHEFFKLKQPKYTNELIGRKVKGFRFENKPKLSCAYTNEMDNYINLIGEIKKYEVDSYKVRFEDNYFWYPADQIEAHLLPEKKTKKQRIEELEKRVEQLEEKLNDYLIPINEVRLIPEFWYVDIQEEKDSELLPRFKEWFAKKVEFRIHFQYYKYGYSGAGHYDGYDWVTYTMDWEGNSDKMQKITLNEWNNWFNK